MSQVRCQHESRWTCRSTPGMGGWVKGVPENRPDLSKFFFCSPLGGGIKFTKSVSRCVTIPTPRTLACPLDYKREKSPRLPAACTV